MKNDQDHDHDDDHDNDNGPGQAIAPASSGALISLEALAKALNTVDMTATSGRSNIPMLQFASRENGVDLRTEANRRRPATPPGP